MRTRSVWWAALGLVLSTGPVAAAYSDAVLCAQQGLHASGFDPGTIDGLLGRKTTSAAEAYAAAFAGMLARPPQLPLTEDNAAAWCKAIALSRPEFVQYYALFTRGNWLAFLPGFNVKGARMESLWDEDFYRSQAPDAGPNPLFHYRREGWKLGLDPSPWFDTTAYLAANRDLIGVGLSPLDQYVTFGMDELRGFGGVPDESGFIFDIGTGVTVEEEEIVREGLALAQSYLEEHYGGDIPAEIRSHVTVKIDATGRGNAEPGSFGGNATGLSARNDKLPRPYWDFGHPDTNQDTSGRGWTQRNEQLGMVIHEYVHGWQLVYGHQSMYEQPLGNWINEGVATSIAVSALVDAGKMDRAAWDLFQARASGDTGEASVPLKALQPSNSRPWSGHIGYLAIEWLVAESPNGKMSLRILHDEVVRTNSVPQAFKAAFNIDLFDFYDQFEAWRPIILNNPRRALALRPALVNIGE